MQPSPRDFLHVLALSLGGGSIRCLLTGVPGMDARELGDWQRFYSRHPFGPVRGDLQAWLVARNCGEAFSGKLRNAQRAALGMTKHRRGRRVTGGNVRGETLALLSKAMGCAFTAAGE